MIFVYDCYKKMELIDIVSSLQMAEISYPHKKYGFTTIVSPDWLEKAKKIIGKKSQKEKLIIEKIINDQLYAWPMGLNCMGGVIVGGWLDITYK